MWDINRDDKRTVEAKCPQCGELMANMGLDFASPPSTRIKEWHHLKTLYSVGITFHSCGCTGPGYIPKDKESLIQYFKAILRDYHLSLSFWRQRIEPQSKREIDRENTKHWREIKNIPAELHPKKGVIDNIAAKKYWLDRIKLIEDEIGNLPSSD
jgi:hypothetical protein